MTLITIAERSRRCEEIAAALQSFDGGEPEEEVREYIPTTRIEVRP